MANVVLFEGDTVRITGGKWKGKEGRLIEHGLYRSIVRIDGVGGLVTVADTSLGERVAQGKLSRQMAGEPINYKGGDLPPLRAEPSDPAMQEYIVVRDTNTNLRLLVVKTAGGEWVTDHVRYADADAAQSAIDRNQAYEGALWQAGRHPAQARAAE